MATRLLSKFSGLMNLCGMSHSLQSLGHNGRVSVSYICVTCHTFLVCELDHFKSSKVSVLSARALMLLGAKTSCPAQGGGGGNM